ncbi:hypothetical protein TRAPUB_11237 [Trametes pubescens]|uniref:Uncharacterized protein n=1 Tax=Trametes pubescens TaxID=154538 RepID=A0A1M2VX79_TRAPU|nr:hypothetical protein TRAPUB_11237 [Trametes pubescens]
MKVHEEMSYKCVVFGIPCSERMHRGEGAPVVFDDGERVRYPDDIRVGSTTVDIASRRSVDETRIENNWE